MLAQKPSSASIAYVISLCDLEARRVAARAQRNVGMVSSMRRAGVASARSLKALSKAAANGIAAHSERKHGKEFFIDGSAAAVNAAGTPP